MKATLEFDLPEEREEHIHAVKGLDWALVVIEIDNVLRGWNKHSPQKFKSAAEAIDAIRDELREIMSSRGVDFDMVS